jgi:hypothetical protein
MCFGLPLGIVGIVLFVLSTRNGHGIDVKAGIGLALSILGFILSIVAAFIIIIGLLSSYDNDYSSYRDNSNPFEYFIEEYGDSLDYDDSDEYQNLPYYFDENEDEQINEL